MLPYQFRPWTTDDLSNLLLARPTESRQIEYKAELPKPPEAGAKGKHPDLEFLEDVTAFANTVGGAILFGIKEHEGEPVSVLGLPCVDLDKERLRLSQILDGNLDPVLRGFDFDVISSSDGKNVLILRIPQSPNAPHMVKKGTRNFMARGPSGKIPMEASDIRAAFLNSQLVTDRAAAFVSDRLDVFCSSGRNFELRERGFVVTHLVPLTSFQRPISLSIKSIKEQKDFLSPPDDGDHNSNPIIALNGFGIGPLTGSYGNSYTMMYRNGVIESASHCLFTTPRGANPVFKTGTVVVETIEAWQRYEGALNALGLFPPYLVFMTLVECDTAILDQPGRRDYGGIPQRVPLRAIPSERLELPPTEVQSPVDWVAAMRHFADLLQNCIGGISSPYFKEDGTLKEGRR